MAWVEQVTTSVGLGNRLSHRPVGALGRPAAARRRRPRARLAPDRDVRRRADRQPRLHHQRRDPRPAAHVGRRARPDHGDGHPRRARGGDRRPRAVPRRRRHRARPAALQRAQDPRDARGGERADDRGRPQGARGPQGPRPAHRARRGHRRLDGQRHLHPHRHDAEGVRRDLRLVLRRRPTPSSAARRSSRAPRAAAPPCRTRCWRRSSALPEVEAAGGTIGLDEANKSEIIGRDGKLARRPGRQPDVRARLRHRPAAVQPAQAQERRLGRRAPTQVVVDAGTAADEQARGRRHRARSPRSACARTTRSPASPRSATSTRSAARRWRSSTPDTAAACCTRRASTTASRSRRRTAPRPPSWSRPCEPLVPASLQVQDSAKAGRGGRRRRPTSGLDFIRYFFLGFGAIALFVGSFVIFNTLSITVAQRTREFATLRTLGASRKQVMRSVVLEGLVIGLVASLIGLVAGFGIYKGLNALFVALGADLPKSGTVIATRTIIVSLLLGTIVTLIASILPARRATRVPPIAAVREGAELPAVAARRRTRRSWRSASSWPRSRRSRVGVFASVGTLGRRRAARRRRDRAVHRRRAGRAAAREAARAAGRLARPPHRRRRGRAGERERGPQPEPHGLDGRRADDRPHAGHGRRRARRRAALLRRGRGDRPGRGRRTSSTPATTCPSAPPRATQLATVDGVKAASHVRTDTALVKGEESDVTGIDPATIDRFYTFDWVKGDDAHRAGAGRRRRA